MGVGYLVDMLSLITIVCSILAEGMSRTKIIKFLPNVSTLYNKNVAPLYHVKSRLLIIDANWHVQLVYRRGNLTERKNSNTARARRENELAGDISRQEAGIAKNSLFDCKEVKYDSESAQSEPLALLVKV